MKVVELQSITKAAEELNYTQSGVSHIIKNLEKELGFRLLIRNNKSFKLTSEGEQILTRIKAIADSEELLWQDAGQIMGVQQGHIKIGTCCSVSANWLPYIIKEFRELHPGVEFELYDNDYDITEELLENDFLDCAFIPVPNSEHLTHELLSEDEYKVVINKNHPLAQMESIDIMDLNGVPFIMPCEGMNYGLGKLFKDAGIVPETVARAKDDFGTLALVEAGIGVTILTELFLRSFDIPTAVKSFENPSYRHLGISLHKGRDKSPVLSSFYDFSLDWIRNNG